MKLYALLDVGGTEIKRRTVSEDGIPIDQITHFPSKSKADSATIINNLSEIIRNGNGMLPECVAMAFPGPFDYENGISYMKGIGKYDSIYGKPLRCMLYKALGREMPILFINDVEAFALGSAATYDEAGKGRCIAVAIGTGCGSAFMENGKCLKNGENAPENGWIYNTAFRNGTIDDYISSRGQTRLAMKYFGKDISGRELHRMACEGCLEAKLLFTDFGKDLLDALQPFLGTFMPQTLVLGGMISRSFQFFGADITEYAGKHGIRIIIAEDTSALIHRGLFHLIQGGQDA